jgi:uncharacterized protein
MSSPRSSDKAMLLAPKDRSVGSHLFREFLSQQLVLFVGLMAAGFIVAYLQYGYVPGSDKPFPLAGVRVPIWHLVWMGVWTGYTMGLVGQAAGIFALPYSTSVLEFSNPHVTPTMLVLTLFNPIGALLGFRRGGQWNLDLAAAVCAGGLIGGIIGPFARATVLSNGDTFKVVLGVALALFGLQLCYRAVSSYRQNGNLAGSRFVAKEPAQNKKPAGFALTTTSRTFWRIGIRFGREERRLSNVALFVTGLFVGIFSSALGVGGGFLLVPIFAVIWRLPIYVMVAATIPFTLALSFAGIFTFDVILPLLGTPAIAPEWSWGLFAAAGGVIGSWVASKTQVYFPEHVLGLMLGTVTGIVGFLYVLSEIVELPFKL